MRIFSILTAILVMVSLYLLVIERDDVVRFAGGTVAEAGTDAEETEARPDGVAVVALASSARRIDSAVQLRGRTEALRSVDVKAETSGKIVSAPLRKGNFVEEGQLLCELDPGTREVALREAQARLAEAKTRRPEAEARLAEAEARLREARVNQNAATQLARDGFASETRVVSSDAVVETALAGIEAANSTLLSADAGVQGAEAAVAAARTELDRLKIMAPFAGLLESDTAELGALMQPGGLCATIIQLDPIKLVGFVPETDVNRVTVGAPAQARLASGREIEGEVTFLSRSADPETRTFRTEITVPNPELEIRDGQTTEITIASEGREAHLLPQSSLTLNDGGELGVRLADEDDVARFREVQILRDTPEGVYVTGLDDDVRVIVVGQEFVTDGVPLRVTMREEGG